MLCSQLFRDLSLSFCIAKSVVFLIVMYRCESWTVKKAEGQRIDAFELWCWRRLLRVPWMARRSNQSILKEINSEYSLEGLMLKLKLVLWPPNAKSQLIGKDPAGEDWRQEEKGTTGRDGWVALLTQWTWVWANIVKDREAWCAAVHGVKKSWIGLSGWRKRVIPQTKGRLRT